ncbi:GNAT family N-acetyltransferase [Sphingomonas alba]|uniref:GNAT family N-acetyltransferase n=1 Tax=Sphingomonas alba TaxID=2908208 RepID=A0ABT0RKT7_9SPHN|nr:GNAT family N-acetyltransferase [Sphingomonas alba]MCL6683210.1 GNAT family N-acetyltransferase [Sphingomonas alba]
MEVTSAADPDVLDTILGGLGRFNQERTGETLATPLNVLLRDDKDEVVGGLWGHSYFRWLCIEYLFLPQEWRRSGTGRQLIEAAERAAIYRGCIGVWLNTFGFQAPGFYERLGYELFGKLTDCPPGQHRHFYFKHL